MPDGINHMRCVIAQLCLPEKGYFNPTSPDHLSDLGVLAGHNDLINVAGRQSDIDRPLQQFLPAK